MNIAFFVTDFPSLSQTFILNQITGLIDRGHTVDIYARRRGTDDKVHPDVIAYKLLERTSYPLDVPRNPLQRYFTAITILGTHMWTNPKACLLAFTQKQNKESKFSLNLLYAIKPFLPRKSYDVIHCHFGPTGIQGTLFKKMGVLEGNIVTTYYGHDVTRYPRQRGGDIYRPLFETGSLFNVLSGRMKRQLVEMGCDQHRVVVHHLGVDCRRFSFTQHSPGKDGAFRILTIARFVEKKGLVYALGAVAKLIEAGIKVKYRMIGDGPLLEDIQQLIHKHELGSCVDLLGAKDQSEILRWINESDVLLAPSVTSSDGDEEGTPTVLLEAMACGLPVVSTVHSGIPEQVQDGVSGFLVRERDVDALAERLTYLIENPQRWPEMGRAGRAYVEQHFDINKLNDRLVELYQRMTEER